MYTKSRSINLPIYKNNNKNDRAIYIFLSHLLCAAGYFFLYFLFIKNYFLFILQRYWWRVKSRGAHPPWDRDALPPLFQISPYFRKIFGLSEFFLQFYLFPKNFLTFIRQNFWWLFLVIAHKFRLSPLFSLFRHIPPFTTSLDNPSD